MLKLILLHCNDRDRSLECIFIYLLSSQVMRRNKLANSLLDRIALRSYSSSPHLLPTNSAGAQIVDLIGRNPESKLDNDPKKQRIKWDNLHVRYRRHVG